MPLLASGKKTRKPIGTIASNKAKGAPDGTDHPKWYPGIHYIALVGLALRLAMSFASDQVFHPDEIFQYLEQAHRLTFGYGCIPWEYRFGIRSWILPGFISGWLFAFKFLHMDNPGTYIPAIKALFCVLSTSLIYSVYIIARNAASERAGRIAAVLTCFWYELVFFAPKAVPEILSAYLLIAAAACVVVKSRYRRPLLFGLLAALSLVLRFQYMPAVAILALAVCVLWDKWDIFKAAASFLMVIAMAGFIDFLTWGEFFVSYYNNYLFNKVYGLSEIFGVQPSHWFYPVRLLIASGGILIAAGILGLTKITRTWLPLACAVGIILLHTLVPHKEYRFVLAAIPLLLIIAAITLSGLTAEYASPSKKRLSYALASLCLFVISLLGIINKLPLEKIVYPVPLIGKQEILVAYKFLNREPDLAAVLNAYQPWWDTGGYYYLHRDVPVYFPHHLLSRRIGPNRMSQYVSHIVCPVKMREIPGFTSLRRIKDLEIREQTHPHSRYRKLDVDTRYLIQPGIDGRYRPTVKRRL